VGSRAPADAGYDEAELLTTRSLALMSWPDRQTRAAFDRTSKRRPPSSMWCGVSTQGRPHRPPHNEAFAVRDGRAAGGLSAR
jgi:hypothetical protein